MSNVINYSKPSATVFKRGIKGSGAHETYNPLVCGGKPGAREWEPGSLDPGPTEWGGQLPKTPWFSTTPMKAWAEHLKDPGSNPNLITNSTPWVSYFTFLNCKTGMGRLHTSKGCGKPDFW